MFALNLTRISVYNFHVHYSQELAKMFQNRPNIWNPNLTLLGVPVHCEVCEFLDSSIITNVGCHEHQLQQASKDGRSMLNLRTPIDDESVFFVPGSNGRNCKCCKILTFLGYDLCFLHDFYVTSLCMRLFGLNYHKSNLQSLRKFNGVPWPYIFRSLESKNAGWGPRKCRIVGRPAWHFQHLPSNLETNMAGTHPPSGPWINPWFFFNKDI